MSSIMPSRTSVRLARFRSDDSWAAIEKAFPGDSSEKMPRGNFNQLAKLKQKYPTSSP
jgi:hypothetical protein